MTIEEFARESMRIEHAMQSAVAFGISRGAAETEPKHLRVGINQALDELGSIAKLLIDKGVITEEEYFAAVLDGQRRELAGYEARYGTSFA